ncbi:MAG: hypothetical protein WB036_26380, partial [Pseudolabrys sp.]
PWARPNPASVAVPWLSRLPANCAHRASTTGTIFTSLLSTLISAPSIWLTSLEEHGRSFTPAHILGGWAFRLAGDTADTPMPVIAAPPLVPAQGSAEEGDYAWRKTGSIKHR